MMLESLLGKGKQKVIGSKGREETGWVRGGEGKGGAASDVWMDRKELYDGQGPWRLSLP